MSYLDDHDYNFFEITKTNRLPQSKVLVENDQYKTNQYEIPVIDEDKQDAYSSLIEDTNWNYNKLSDLALAYYKFRLFQIEEKHLQFSQFPTYQEMFQTIMNLKQVTIAETGVTGTCITHVDMNSVPAINAHSRSFQQTNITMKLKEPAGVSFMDTLKRSAQYLGIRDFKNCCYYLSLTFGGYDDQGNIIENPCKEFENGGVWLYQIKILDIQQTIDSTGSEYTVDIIPWSEQILKDNSGNLANPISIEASTVGELFVKLGNQMTANDEDMYGYNLKSYKFSLPTFRMDDKEYDMSKWSIKSINEEQYNTKATVSMIKKDGKIKAHFPKGTSVKDIVETVFRNSEEAMQLAKGVASPKEIETDENKARNCIVYSSNIVAEMIGFDEITNNYIINYTISIYPYFTQRPILTAQQIKNSQSVDNQATNIKQLRNAGYLCKRYDHILTGKNTEILNLNNELKLSWAAMLPLSRGFNNSIESNTTYDKYRKNTVDEVRELQVKLQDVRSKLESLEELRREEEEIKTQETKSDSQKYTKDTKLKEIAAKKSAFNEDDLIAEKSKIQSKIKDKKISLAKDNKVHEDMISNLPDRSYGEEISNSDIQNYLLPISIQQDTSDQARFLNSGVFPDYYHRDRTLFGAVMDQLYTGTTGGAMQTITMDVRGDPFWLGPSSLLKSWQDSNNINGRDILASKHNVNMAEFAKGDTYFLLRVKYPAGIDEMTQNLILNEDVSMTGVYHVYEVHSKFEEGKFEQTLTCSRMPLINIYETFGYVDAEKIKRQEEQQRNNQELARRGRPVT